MVAVCVVVAIYQPAGNCHLAVPVAVCCLQNSSHLIMIGTAKAPIQVSLLTLVTAGTSLEGNNVFTVQPNVYFEGQDPTQESASMYATGVEEGPINPATVTIGIVAVGIVAVAGTATAIYYEVSKPAPIHQIWQKHNRTLNNICATGVRVALCWYLQRILLVFCSVLCNSCTCSDKWTPKHKPMNPSWCFSNMHTNLLVCLSCCSVCWC